jgi:hypothetical protein
MLDAATDQTSAEEGELQREAYNAAFLTKAIESAKAHCYVAMQAGGACKPPKLDWAELHRAQVGV